MRTLILLLLITASAQCQFVPMAFWKSSAAPAFTPTSIDSLKLWLKADAITGKSSGDTLYRWPASYGNDAFQLTAAKKPIYYADSVNGHPSVYFDGVDDAIMAYAINDNTTQTAFIVIKRRTIPGAYRRYLVGLSNAGTVDYVSADNMIVWSDSMSVKNRAVSSRDYLDLSSATVPESNVAYMVRVQNTGTVITSGVNGGIPENTVSETRQLKISKYVVGSGWYSPDYTYGVNSHICEVIIYSTSLTAGQISSVETYLRNRWGTP